MSPWVWKFRFRDRATRELRLVMPLSGWAVDLLLSPAAIRPMLG
jgi:hypothetical protein